MTDIGLHLTWEERPPGNWQSLRKWLPLLAGNMVDLKVLNASHDAQLAACIFPFRNFSSLAVACEVLAEACYILPLQQYYSDMKERKREDL